LKIYISHGRVATQLRCGGIFNNHIIANCPQSMPVKKKYKIGQHLAQICTKDYGSWYIWHKYEIYKI